MGAISDVIKFLGWLQEALYKAYLEINDWVWPFWMGAWPFYLAADAVNRLGWAFYDFYDWVQEVSGKLPFVMTPSELIFWISTFFPGLSGITQWFSDWWAKVTSVITSWWSATSSTVVGWIDAAKDWAKLWIDWLDERITELTSSLNTFVLVTLPTLPNWLDIDALIKSWFVSFSPLWEGWQELKGEIMDFISDPEQWFYDRLEEIFERYW